MIDIHHRTGYALSTVHRCLHNLKAEGLVVQQSTAGRYALGMEATELANRILRGASRGHWLEILQEVNLTTSYSTLLGQFRRNGFTYIEHLPATTAMSVRGRAGDEGPLHCTSIGKSVLSVLPTAQFESLVQRMELTPETNSTITELADFRAEIAQVKDQGFSTTLGEHEPKVASIAVPVVVTKPHSVEYYGLCIAGHISEFEEIKKYHNLLVEQASRMAATFSRW